MSPRIPLNSVLGRRTLIADGAMGTMLQRHSLPDADSACLDALNLTAPQLVTDVHRAYLNAGADLIETNTFASHREDLAEAGARLARAAADEASTPERPRWVLGSVGPGDKLVSRGEVGVDAVRDSCARQVTAMVRGGIDAVIIETGLELAALRACVVGAQQALTSTDAPLPILVCVTTRLDGRLPLGDDLTDVAAALVPLGVAGLGINCANGLEGLHDQLSRLARVSSVPLLCLPSAGLPTMTATGLSYPTRPDEFARTLAGLVSELGVAVAGGCCGTTPDHIAALARALGTASSTH